jgi:hypothetical protein
VLIERYHSRSRRARLVSSLDKLSGTGNFAEILALIAAPVELALDGAEFRAACREHVEIEQELALLREAAEQRPQQAVELGGQIAVAAAGALAAAIVCASLFLAA